MQKTGKDVGRREERGVGMGLYEGNRAAGSKPVMVRRVAVGGRRDSRAVKAAWYLAMVYLIGGMESMLCSGSTGVVRKVPLMHQTVTFWATWRIWIMAFEAQ